MVGLRGVARRGADAVVLDLEQVVRAQRLIGGVTPVLGADLGVHDLGEGLGETVGERLGEDVGVVVVGVLELLGDHIEAEARRGDERAHVVLNAAALGGDEVSEREVRLLVVLLLRLLAQREEGVGSLVTRAVLGVELDVVAHRVGGEDAEHGAQRQALAHHDVLEHLLRVVEELLRFTADRLVVEDLRVAAVRVAPAQLPHLEEGVPVDEVDHLLDGKVAQHVHAGLLRGHGGVLRRREVNTQRLGARLLERDVPAVLQPRVELLAHLLVRLARVVDEVILPAVVDERAAHRHGARGVEHVHDRPAVLRDELDSGVHAARGGAANQQWDLDARLLHLLGHGDHLVERGRDEAAQAEDVGLVFPARVQDALARAHDAKVDDLPVVAPEHHGDDVLADVVHVTLHRGDDEGAHTVVIARGDTVALRDKALLFLHKGDQMRDGLLHHARRLDDLRKEHLARAEEVADGAHAVHKRALDDVERPRIVPGHARLLGVTHHELVDTLNQRVAEAARHVHVAPTGALSCRSLDHSALLAQHAGLGLRIKGCGVFEHTLRGVVAAVEHEVLDVAEQLLVDVLVLVLDAVRGIDNAHIHARGAGVVQEHRVARTAHRLVAAEAERQVGHAARDLGARADALDLARGVDEVDSVVVVLRHARANRQDVRVEDDVLRVEAYLLDENAVRALAHAHLLLARRSLAVLVEGHHHHGAAVRLDHARVLEELLLSALERDRVYDGLALAALDAALHHVELGRVDHEGVLRRLGVRHQQVDELGHRADGLDEAVVDVDVDDVRAHLHLLHGDAERLVPITVDDGLLEDARARDVAALADVHEGRAHVGQARLVVERLQAREAHDRLDAVGRTRRVALGQVDHRLDVLERGAAAAADAVEDAILHERTDLLGELVALLVVAAHGVGQARVRVAEDVAVRAAAQVLDVRLHVARAQRAVQADSQRLVVRQRVPERLVGLPRERAPRVVDDGARHEDGDPRALVGEELVDREERRLGVERVEDRFDQEEVDAARQQALALLVVRLDDLVPRAAAEGGVLHRRRHRQRLVGRADGTRREARPRGVLLRPRHRTLLRQLGRRLVDGEDLVIRIERVVALRDERAVECVGLNDVGARLEEVVVDLLNHVGARQHQ
mmetsp:Transcript_7282/g.22028  ORF Transcript_7282/g.22028 Transcript_7282/m.22028 type:complete len:1134 (+) Transcript_7282:306-3707(+)